MKNIICYYYNLNPLYLNDVKYNYFFECNGDRYVFVLCTCSLNDVTSLYKLNKQMLEKDILVHEIIMNNDENIITYVNGKPYILMKIQFNINGLIDVNDIYDINIKTIGISVDKALYRNNWKKLWESKNDYIENQITEIGNKYPVIYNYLNYYIGLAENAIKYVSNTLDINQDAELCVCHRRIKKNEHLLRLYNPLNFIYDFRVRDICEYVKSVFFEDEALAFDLIINYFNNTNLNYKEALLFYGRLLYPSYFFDLYDDIINGASKEKEIEHIIVKSTSYETFLKNVYLYLSNMYETSFPSIDWIMKKR